MSKAYTYAVKLLANREHSQYELISKLTAKNFDNNEIHITIAELIRLNLQSDERFVDMIIRARIAQGYGPDRISNELKYKNIAKELIYDKLDLEKENWVDIAQNAWKKKYDVSIEYSSLEIQKQKKFLYTRGFSTDIINKVFECLIL